MKFSILGKTIFNFERRGVENPATPLSRPAEWLLDFFGRRSRAGVNVNERSALGLSAVWQAVRVKCDMISTLPWEVHRITENGKVLAKDHPLFNVINKKCSPHLTSYQFRWIMQALLELRGRAFARIHRTPEAAGYNVLGFEILNPSIVTPFFVGEGFEKELWHKIDGEEMPVHDSDMIFLRNFTTDFEGKNTMSPITMGAENIALGIAAQEFESAFFGNGAHISGYLSFPGKLAQEQKKNIGNSWKTRHGGVNNSGSTPVLEGGMEYKRIGLTPQESMLSESRKLSIEDVARWFNIPLYMLSALDKMSFNNIEVIARDFVQKSLLPVAINWESEFNNKAFKLSEQNEYESSFDFSAMLKGDSQALSQFISTLMDKGLININEGRKMIGLNMIDAEFARKHWVQLNMAEADNRPQPKDQGIDNQANQGRTTPKKPKLNGIKKVFDEN